MSVATLALVAVAVALMTPPAAHAFGPLGEDFRISFMGPNGNTSYSADEPSIAYNSAANEYLVVWSGDDNTPPLVSGEIEIFAQRISASGAPVGARIRVSDTGPDGDTDYGAHAPNVAYNSADNQYLVVWYGDDKTTLVDDDEFEIFGQRLTAAGAETGANDFRISDMGPAGNTAYGALHPRVSYNSAQNQYLVVWRGDGDTAPLTDDEFEIHGQRLDRDGIGVGNDDFRISNMGPDGLADYDATEPSVTYNPADDEFLVVWEGDHFVGTLTNDEFEIFGQRLTAAGAAAGANDFRISDMGPDGSTTYYAAEPSVAYSSTDDQYLVAWEGTDDAAPLAGGEAEIFGQRLTGDGVEGGANDFRISDMGPDGDIAYGAFGASVAYGSADNQFLVTWQGDDNTASLVDGEFEIFGQRLDRGGAEVGAGDFRVSDMGPDGAPLYDASRASLVYGSADNQYLVAWHGDDNTAPLVEQEFEIFGRRLGEPPPPDAGGTPGGGTPDGGATPTDDVLVPRFLRLALSPRVFTALSSGPSVRNARARGTRVTYGLSEAATARFRVQRALAGRRVRGRCVRPTRANRGRPRCKRYRTLRGSFRHDGTAGVNRFRFSGRLARRKLRPGSYRLVATASDAAGNQSRPVRRPFRIVR